MRHPVNIRATHREWEAGQLADIRRTVGPNRDRCRHRLHRETREREVDRAAGNTATTPTLPALDTDSKSLPPASVTKGRLPETTNP